MTRMTGWVVAGGLLVAACSLDGGAPGGDQLDPSSDPTGKGPKGNDDDGPNDGDPNDDDPNGDDPNEDPGAAGAGGEGPGDDDPTDPGAGGEGPGDDDPNDDPGAGGEGPGGDDDPNDDPGAGGEGPGGDDDPNDGTGGNGDEGTGGDGGGGGEEELAFWVVATTPEDGATEVPRDSSLTVTFSAPPQPSTVTTESFTLDNGVVTRTGAFSYLDDDASLSCTPNLGPAQHYTVHLSTEIEDADGHALSAAESFSFLTADGDFVSPQALEATEYWPTVDVATNSSGYRAVVYFDTAEGESSLLVAHAPAGQVLAEEPIWSGSDLPTRAAVSVKDDGTILVLVQLGPDYSTDLFAYARDPETGWEEPELLLDDVDWINPVAKHVDASGRATFVSNYGDGEVYSAFAIQHLPGSGWGELEHLHGAEVQTSDMPELAGNAAGQLVVAWPNGDNYHVHANYYDPLSGWLGAEAIGVEGSWIPRVAIDADGSATVLYLALVGQRMDVYANQYDPLAGWTGSELVETDDTVSASPGGVGVNAEGEAWVLWTRLGPEEADAQLFLSHYESGQGWIASTPIITGASYAWHADHPSGTLLLAWVKGGVLYGSSYHPATGLGAVDVLSYETAGVEHYEVQLAMDAWGNGLLVRPCTETSLCAARYTPEAGWSTLSEVASSTDYTYVNGVAIDGEGRATIAWNEYTNLGVGTVYSLDFR